MRSRAVRVILGHMSTPGLAAAAVAVLLPVSLSAAAPGDAPAYEGNGTGHADRTTTSGGLRLGGVRVRAGAGTRQVVTVNHGRGYGARVSFWRKRDGDWHRLRSTRDGRIGYGGLVRGRNREQGTGTTPLGTYAIERAFGNARAPRVAELPYHRVRKGDFWVQDNRSRYYNRLRNKESGGFRWWLPADRYNGSERLRDYPGQYAWSIVIEYNRPHPVRGRGAGIFLHVNGDGATAGCVSAPRRFIRSTLSRLRGGLHPVIAIGR